MRNLFLTILCVFFLSAASCRFIEADTSTAVKNNLDFEEILHKDGLKDVERVAFPSDGEMFLVSDDLRSITLWEKPFTSSSRRIPIESSQTLSAIKFFGVDQDILISMKYGFVQIWDSKLKTRKFEFKFPNMAREVAISKDGRFIATDENLYDRKKKSLVEPEIPHALCTAVHFGGKSRLVTSGYHDRRVAVRNIYDDDFVYYVLSDSVNEANISSDEKYIVATTYKGRGYFWRWPEKEPKVISIPREKEFHYLAFAPNSKWFVFCGADTMTIFTSEPTERLAHKEFEPALRSVAVVSNNLIVMGDVKGFVHIYDVSAKRIIASHKALKKDVEFLRLIPEKGLLWAATRSFAGNNVYGQGEVALYRVKGLAPIIDGNVTQ